MNSLANNKAKIFKRVLNTDNEFKVLGPQQLKNSNRSLEYKNNHVIIANKRSISDLEIAQHQLLGIKRSPKLSSSRKVLSEFTSTPTVNLTTRGMAPQTSRIERSVHQDRIESQI